MNERQSHISRSIATSTLYFLFTHVFFNKHPQPSHTLFRKANIPHLSIVIIVETHLYTAT